MVAARAVPGMRANAAAAPMNDLRTCMLAGPPVAGAVRRGGSPGRERSPRGSQEVLTLHEKTVSAARVGLAPRRPRASFPDMSHRAAALIVIALLAFPGVVAAQTVTGTPRGDDITGTTGADQINGRGGNDRITGRAGDDHLNGGR